MIIGIISDTHGVLSDDAVKALDGVDQILHAGDIDGPEVLTALADIAPVWAVRGNMDHGDWADTLHSADLMSLNGILIYLIHDLASLDLDPVAAGVKVVVSGHTHQADIQFKHDILYLNPGSATYSRYGSATSIAILDVSSERLQPRIVILDA
jgi:putative phosphoesterase